MRSSEVSQGIQSARADDERVVRTVCRMCHGGCRVRVHVRDGKAMRIEGDPEGLINLGYTCAKGRASIEYAYHPDRVLYPLRRVGKRGEGKWERISWDEALDTVAKELRRIKEQYGPEYIARAPGTGREWNYFGSRFFNALGISLNVGRSPLCYFQRIAISRTTFGDSIPIADYYGFGGEKPKCVLSWGNNLTVVNADGMIGHRLDLALQAGAKLISVDPVPNNLSGRADLWLQLRPVTDGALALAMLNVVITEGLYDRDFVVRWTNGPFLVRVDNGKILTEGEIQKGGRSDRFLVWDLRSGRPRPSDEAGSQPALLGQFRVGEFVVKPAWQLLVERISAYSPEHVSEITWVSPQQIREAARLFATTKPAVIQWGNALDHLGVNSSQCIQTLLILMSITGNLDVPGGMALWVDGPWMQAFAPAHSRPDLMPPKSREMAMRWGGSQFPLLNGSHASLVNRAIAEGELPVQALLVVGHNFVCSGEDTRLLYRTIERIPFIVVFDLFMNPTSAMADIFLPVSTWLERDQINGQHFRFAIQCRQRAIEPLGEARSDEEIFLDLAKRLGLEEHFPWPTYEAYLDWRLAGAGITWQQFKEIGMLSHPMKYRKYETDFYRPGGGFDTPTGKVEIYHTGFQRLGFDPLPFYIEPPVETPYNEELVRDYPLLNTTRKIPFFFHSEYRQVPTLRRACPDPITEISPVTAAELGIEEGDWIFVETPRGRIRQRARLIPGLHPKVVCSQHDWWFPEKPGPEYGIWESNLNVITRSDWDQGFDPIWGGPQLRGFLCRVRKAD